jgi:hypothetical protein
MINEFEYAVIIVNASSNLLLLGGCRRTGRDRQQWGAQVRRRPRAQPSGQDQTAAWGPGEGAVTGTTWPLQCKDEKRGDGGRSTSMQSSKKTVPCHNIIY